MRPPRLHTSAVSGPLRWGWLTLVCLVFAGCSVRAPDVIERDGAPDGLPSMGHVPDAVPRIEPRSRTGNPPSYVVFGRRYHVMDSSRGFVERGIASWYGTKFHGRRTSSGEPYDMYVMTAAHKHLPLPTYAQVTNLENGRSVVVKVNDRGPFHANRVIDLSYAAAYKLGMLQEGTAMVEVRAIDPRQPTRIAAAPAASPPTTHTPSIFVQAGAFSSAQNAQRLRQRLASSLAHEVRVQPVSGAQPLYRVQVGPLGTIEQLDALTARLASLGVSDAHVVID